MPTSLRIPVQKENMIKKAAAKNGKTKTAFIIESSDWSKTGKRRCAILQVGFPTRKRKNCGVRQRYLKLFKKAIGHEDYTGYEYIF